MRRGRTTTARTALRWGPRTANIAPDVGPRDGERVPEAAPVADRRVTRGHLGATIALALGAAAMGACARKGSGEAGADASAGAGASAGPGSGPDVKTTTSASVLTELEPPRLPPWVTPATRLPLLASDGSSDLGADPLKDGIAARLVMARMTYRRFLDNPVSSGNDVYEVSCSVGVVTTRVLSWWCTAGHHLKVYPSDWRGGGPVASDGSIFFENWDYREPEGEPSSISLRGLFRDSVKDPDAAVAKACEKVPPDHAESDTMYPREKPLPRCTVHHFVLLASGLHVMWADDATELNLPYQLHHLTVPWRAFGRDLRPDGPACAFRWSEDDGDAAEDAGTDPCAL